MNRFKKMLAIAVIGCAPMVNTGCEILDALGDQIVNVLDRNEDTLGSRLDDLIAGLGD